MSTSNTYNPFPGGIDSTNIEEVLAFHKATFGGFRMEDEPVEETPTVEETPEGDPAGDESKPDDEAKPDEETPEGDDEGKEDELPEWARKKMTKANSEAARYRTELRELEQKFENAKTPEEVEAVIKETREAAQKRERELMVENVALKFNLPDDLAARLTGATKEELEADAKVLAKFVPEEDEDLELRGGLDPHNRDATPDDPGALARRVNRGRRKSR